MTPTLHIQLLGRFGLNTDDAPVTTLDSPRLQALLAYLLLHRAASPARAHLAFRLWPDTTESQAHANLRTLLHRFRQALPEADRFLHVDAQTVQWRDDGPATLDVADFERALEQAAAAEQVGDQDAAQMAFRDAVEQYRGDLLPGWYDDWVLLERERLRQAFLVGLEKLVLLLEQAGEYAAAIGYAQRLLRHEPLHEATYQHLMRLHARSGDRASAVRVYRTCTTVLERELGVEPSPATHEAYEHLRQMEVQPPPASRSTSPPEGDRRHNLPIALTSFIGRAHELIEVQRLLATTRLLTLTGAGGCGKTRLALAAATTVLPEYPDGVWLVELAELTDPTLVPQAVAAVLGVREEPQRPLTTTLIDVLQPRHPLLVLDNCEHLIAACAQLVQTLLSACPHLRILATSRETLRVVGETTWLVPSLALPAPQPLPPLAELIQYEAVQLFVERAAATLPTFTLTLENASDVVQVCQRLDGIPLAIELAAARVKLLPVAQIAVRLDASFRLLTGGGRTAMPRHQNLRAAIDWSYTLLTEPERALLRRLATFACGWTLETAEAVCAGADGVAVNVLELLAHLVDKSLVVVEMQLGNEARYRLLETIRQYAWEKLSASGERENVRGRHLDFFLRLAEEAEQKVKGAEQAAWMNRLQTEHGNLRRALDWSLQSGQVVAGLRLAGALWLFWVVRGPASEGLERLLEALSRPEGAERTAVRAKALKAAGALQVLQGNYLEGHPLFEEALAIGRELGDKQIIAASLRELGTGVFGQGDDARARSLLEEGLALWREVGSKSDISWSLCFLGDVVMSQGDYQRAQALYEESVALLRELKRNILLAYTLRQLAHAALHQGDDARAVALCKESLTLTWEAGNKRGVAACLAGLAGVVAARGQIVHAAQLFGAAQALLDAIAAVLMPADRREYDRSVAAVRAQLDASAFDAAWATGRARTLEQAIAEAVVGGA